MEIIIRILVMLFLLLGRSQEVSPMPPLEQTPTPTPAQPEGETFHSLNLIGSVQVMLLESYPVQINLQVNGSLSDGCDYPVQVEQRREGNEVFVEIYREMPLAVICPAVLISYSESIRLEGGFETGTYIIHVNDQVVEVTI